MMQRTLRGAAIFILRAAWLPSLILINASNVRAEDEFSCIDGEYVLTVSASEAKKERTIALADQVMPVEIQVAEESSRAVLIKADENGHSNLDLCKQLSRERRVELRKKREEGSKTIVRTDYSCGCNALLGIEAVPNDPSFGSQWGYNQANDIDMNMPQAWDISKGSDTTVVAVIDTGIDYNHPDLVDNLWHNPGEIAGNGIDDDGNGYVDDVYGANMITGGGDPKDDNGHGTHVSGTIGARGNNGLGVTGVNWNVKIMSVKFLGPDGLGSLYDAIEAIDYVTAAKQRGINVVLSNNSWGGGPYIQPLYDAINRARLENILFVAAAGNKSNNNDANPSYPANYDLDNVISVAALDSQGNIAGFSNYGATTVDIAAPGVNVSSTYPDNRYVYLSGTSMACPHVSGALALLFSYAPGLSQDELKDLLLDTGKRLPTLTSAVASSSMVDAHAMLAALNGGNPPPTAAPTPTPPNGTPGPNPTGTPAPTPTPSATPTPGSYSIYGNVRNVDGSPMAGVKLSLIKDNVTVAVLFSGPNGQYKFTIVSGPREYTIKAHMSGFTLGAPRLYVNRDTLLNFNGWPAKFKLSGQIVSETKQPLAGVAVDAGSLGGAVTDGQGRFVFDAPYGYSYSIKVWDRSLRFDSQERRGIIRGDVERVFVASPG